jgi:hypothetical protein
MSAMRRTLIIVALCGLASCYFKTPTHQNELDGGNDPSDARDEDAEAEVDGDVPEDGAVEAPRCMCSAPTPVCIPETDRCVECQSDSQCSSGSYCLVATGQCVACLNANHCANKATASVCDTEKHVCVPCRAGMDTDCSNVNGLNVCNAGTCVQCTADRRSACGEDKPLCSAQLTCTTCSTDLDCQRFGKVCDEASARCVGCTLDSEQAQCASKSCNPASKQCTQTERGSVALCNKCVADSECMAEQRCVELFFAGGSRGGYCMQRASACAPPFQAPPIHRASLSGAAAENYCGIAEQTASCEAILALQAALACNDATQCNAPGALCASVNRGVKACTYACETNFECPSSTPCGGSGMDKYCGR